MNSLYYFHVEIPYSDEGLYYCGTELIQLVNEATPSNITFVHRYGDVTSKILISKYLKKLRYFTMTMASIVCKSALVASGELYWLQEFTVVMNWMMTIMRLDQP